MAKRKNLERKRIRYFVGFDTQECYSENRNVSTAAMTKASYICKKINEIGYGVDIISNATSKNKSGVYKSHKYILSEHNTLFLTPSFCSKNEFFRIVNRCLSNIWLLVWGGIHLKKNETIVVYHGLDKERVILFLKKIKALTLVLEAEELYQNVGKQKTKLVQLENMVMQQADKFIVITEELNKVINKKSKAYCVLNGTYEYLAESKKNNSNITRLVYAGTFDSEKGGVYRAIDVMEELPDTFVLDVLGFGTEKEIANVKQYICNRRDKRNNVNYVGLKRDQEFLHHLAECDIGLSTQNSQGEYNDTSFPSKILTYICCGLKVVSVKIPVVEKSSISSCVIMYDDNCNTSLAEAIIKATHLDINCESVIARLDDEFGKTLRCLFN